MTTKTTKTAKFNSASTASAISTDYPAPVSREALLVAMLVRNDGTVSGVLNALGIYRPTTASLVARGVATYEGPGTIKAVGRRATSVWKAFPKDEQSRITTELDERIAYYHIRGGSRQAKYDAVKPDGRAPKSAYDSCVANGWATKTRKGYVFAG
jgi:hypothetical protein